MSAGRALIRPYREADRDSVLAIAADTAFFGQPVEHFWEDRRLFADLLYRYYLDVEPEQAWIAQVEEQVIGFVVGSADTAGQRRRWLRHVLPLVLSRLLRGHYHLGPRSRRYAVASIRNWLRYGRIRADVEAYPAHLHTNLRASRRGQGIGTELLHAYLDHLRAAGVPGVHLHTTDRNEAACALYEKLGFHLLEAHRSLAWEPFLEVAVQSRCYGLSLNRFSRSERAGR